MSSDAPQFTTFDTGEFIDIQCTITIGIPPGEFLRILSFIRVEATIAIAVEGRHDIEE